MLRNIIAILVLVSGAVQLMAQSEIPLPNDAQTLRSACHQARERALQPLTVKYKAELEKLLAAHTKGGRLDEALAIRKEIELLEIPSSSNATQQSKATSKAERLRAELSGSRWDLAGYQKRFIMTLHPDGSITYEPSEGAPRTNAWFVDESGSFFTRDPIVPEPRKSAFERGDTKFDMNWGAPRTATRIKK